MENQYESSSSLTAGEQVRYYRKKKGLTQKELAYNTGISTRYLQKIEMNQSDTKISSLTKMANQLGTPACFLLNAFQCDNLRNIGFDCVKEILDQIPVAIFVCDLDGKLVYTSPAYKKIFGIKKENSDIFLWSHSSDLEEESTLQEKIVDLLSTQKILVEPIRTKKRTINGNIVESLLILDCMRSSKKALTGLVGALILL